MTDEWKEWWETHNNDLWSAQDAWDSMPKASAEPVGIVVSYHNGVSLEVNLPIGTKLYVIPREQSK